MKYILIAFIFFSSACFSQSETHNFITYDTTIQFPGSGQPIWTLRITRPADMFTAGNADTASRPAIVSMPGLGEVGTDHNYLSLYGPHYWLNNGWDGSVILSNGVHYPILITIITNTANVRPWYTLALIQHLLNTYHIKRSSLHLAGLSHGGFTFGRMITYAATVGDETAMSLVKSYTCLQGLSYESFNGATSWGKAGFGHWAKKYGGKFFGLEGTTDGRKVYEARDNIVDSGSVGYFSFEDYGGGAHCCWNTMYDPSITDWQCTAPITNGNIKTNTNHPNSLGTYKKGSNLFQCILRSGDTVLVGSGTDSVAASAGSDQVIALPQSTVSLNSASSTGSITSYAWAQISGPSTATINIYSSSIASASGLVAGVYVFRVTVVGVNTSTDDVSVTVNPAVNTAPVVSCGPDKIITLPINSVSLVVSVNDNAGPWVYAWSKVSGPSSFAITAPTANTTDVTGLVSGTYVFACSVTDAGGLAGSDQITIIVNPLGNALPVANAGADKQIGLPTNFTTITGTGTDADGTISSYTWTKISGPSQINIATPNSANTSLSSLVEGVYVFELKVQDNSGGVDKDTVRIVVVAPLTNRPNVGCGEYQVFFTDKDRHLYGLGNLTNIGTNNTGPIGVPKRCLVSPLDLEFKELAGGLHGGAAIDVNGSVWTMGDNDQGQLGKGDLNPTYLPVKILIDSVGNPFTNIRKVIGFYLLNPRASNGWYFIKEDSTLWATGRLLGGMRGNGTDNTHADSFATRPVQIFLPGNRKVIDVSTGVMAIALANDGTVWTWGFANNNNSGYGATGNDYMMPHQVLGMPFIDKIAGAGGFNYALTQDGLLYGWGASSNYMGDQVFPSGGGSVYATPRLLTNITNNLPGRIVKIATTYASTHVILEDGSLWGWGDASQGTIGNGVSIDWKNYATPYAWNTTDKIYIKVPVNIAPGIKFDEIFGGNVYNYYVYFRDINGNLYCTGRGKSSILATGIYLANSTLEQYRQNAIDRKWITPVDPFAITTAYVCTSPDCAVNPSGTNCSGYVIPVNAAPIARSVDQSIISYSTQLDATASTDNVYISYYEWSQVSGPSTAIIDLPASKTPRVSNLLPGIYVFRLTVTDNGWLTNSTDVTVTVSASVPVSRGYFIAKRGSKTNFR